MNQFFQLHEPAEPPVGHRAGLAMPFFNPEAQHLECTTMDILWNDDDIVSSLKNVDELEMDWPAVDVLEVKGADPKWLLDVEKMIEGGFNRYCENLEEVALRIFFIRTARTWGGEGDVRHDVVSPEVVRTLKSRTSASNLFISRLAQAQTWVRFGEAQSSTSGSGNDDAASQNYFYEYAWSSFDTRTGPSLIDCTRNGNQTTYFCVNYPDAARKHFEAALNNDASTIAGSFLIDRLALDACTSILRESIEKGHRVLKRYENLSLPYDFESATTDMHKLSMSFTTLRTNAENLETTLLHVQSCQDTFSRIRKTAAPDRGELSNMAAQISSCRTIHRWIESYERRIQVQLNLLMHRITISESQASKNLAAESRDLAVQSKEIAQYTAALARQTTQDSASMITIAAVTMFFLPATFVSSFFETGFFSFTDSGQMLVFPSIWIYPAVVIPLTILVFLCWYLWMQWREWRRRIKKKAEARTGPNGVRIPKAIDPQDDSGRILGPFWRRR